MNLEQQVQLSLTVLLTGLVIVFTMLVFLTYLIKGYSAAVRKFMAKNIDKNERQTIAPAPAPVAIARLDKPSAAPAVEAGISEEVVAAISAAVYTMYGTSGAAVTNIRRSAQPPTRSAWAMAGLLENTRPF